jgi:hypothetical protein
MQLCQQQYNTVIRILQAIIQRFLIQKYRNFRFLQRIHKLQRGTKSLITVGRDALQSRRANVAISNEADWQAVNFAARWGRRAFFL